MKHGSCVMITRATFFEIAINSLLERTKTPPNWSYAIHRRYMFHDLPSDMENEVLKTGLTELRTTSIAKTPEVLSPAISRIQKLRLLSAYFQICIENCRSRVVCCYKYCKLPIPQFFFRCTLIHSPTYKIPFPLLIAFVSVDESIKILY